MGVQISGDLHSEVLVPYQERPIVHSLEFHFASDPKRDTGKMYPLIALASDARQKSDLSSEKLQTKLVIVEHDFPLHYVRAHAYTKSSFDHRLLLHTPDERLNKACLWSEISMDQFKTLKGSEVALLTGIYSVGDSDCPGFGWFFERDSLWGGCALNSEGDFATIRAELEFLFARQRDDGKIMHEFAQTAEFVDKKLTCLR